MGGSAFKYESFFAGKKCKGEEEGYNEAKVDRVDKVDNVDNGRMFHNSNNSFD